MIIAFFLSLMQLIPNAQLQDLNPGYLIITHDTGNCKLSLCSFGHIGYTGSNQAQGEGFKYPKTSVSHLFFGGLAIGNSKEYVADAFFGLQSVDSRDFRIIDSLYRFSRLGLQEYKMAINDGNHPTPKNLRIEQYSLAIPDPRYDDGVIIEYAITNEGAAPIGDLYVGIFLDWDLGTANTNRAGTDTIRRATWMRQAATDNPTVGTKILYPYSWANLFCTDHDIYVYPVQGMHDTTKYKIMSGAIRKYASDRNYDWSTCNSVGPFLLNPGERVVCAFAILGGTSLANFQANCDSLQSFYDNNVGISAAPKKNLPFLRLSPNPFNKKATITLSLPQKEFFSLSLYDITGRLLTNLYRGKGDSYTGEIKRPQSSGIYFLRLEGQETKKTWKVIVTE